jgi:hypothetical protein
MQQWSLTWVPLPPGPTSTLAPGRQGGTTNPAQGRECVAWVPQGGKCAVGRLTLAAGLRVAEGGPIPNGAQVSRAHALLSAEAGAEAPGAPLHLTDLGSKFGTEVNGQPVQAQVPFPLHSGDVVRFGARDARFRVARGPVPHLVSSGLSQDQLGRASLVCRALGWTLSPAWTARATHFLLPALKPTLRVLQALAVGQHLVHPAWLDAIHVEGSLHLTCVADFLPPIVSASPLLQGQRVSFFPDAQRASLFATQTFLFRDSELRDRLAPLVESAQGACVLLLLPPPLGEVERMLERLGQLARPPGAQLLWIDDDPTSSDIQEMCAR